MFKSTFFFIFVVSNQITAQSMATTEPSSSKPGRKPQMNITAKPEEIALIERVAEKRGLSVSALLRSLALDEARRLGVE